MNIALPQFVGIDQITKFYECEPLPPGLHCIRWSDNKGRAVFGLPCKGGERYFGICADEGLTGIPRIEFSNRSLKRLEAGQK